jgi:hypothetical protein
MDYNIFKTAILRILNYFGILYILDLLFDIIYSVSKSNIRVFIQIQVKQIIFYTVTIIFIAYFISMIVRSKKKEEYKWTLFLFIIIQLLLIYYYC